MVTMPDIDRLMSGSLGDFLQEQRGAREQATKDAWNRGWKVAMVLGPLFVFALIAIPVGFELKIYGFMIACVAAWGWARGPIREAKKRVKIGINESIADALGLSYSHDGDEGREFELAKQFKLLPSHSRSSVEDFWSGDLDGRDFLLHEAHCEVRRGSGKNRRWVTVFRGAIIRIASGRGFYGTTLVRKARASESKSWFGLGAPKDSLKFGGYRLQRIDMVHPDFEDQFEVWSDDPTEAKLLVDPLYVERLLAMENAFNGQGICSLFVEGDILVAVRGGNMFESGSMNPESDRFMVENCARQFQSMGLLAKRINRQMGFQE